MPYVNEINLTLSVHSDVLFPEQISDLAGVQPSDFYRIGDSFGRVRKGLRKSNYWSLNQKIIGEDETAECTEWFSDGVVRLLEQVSTKFSSRLSDLDSEATAVVWVGLFGIQNQGAFNIRPDASKMLGEYGLELVFDMYIDNDS